MHKKIIVYFGIILLYTASASAQGTSMNTSGAAADTSAMLDISSTAKGVLVPRLTQTQRNTIVLPANGLLIFQTDNVPGFYYNSGGSLNPAWVMVGSGISWSLNGNAGTTDFVNFIGTTDNVPLNIKVNNQYSGRIDPVKLNAFYGYQCGNGSTDGTLNTAMGHQALQNLYNGNNNTAIGQKALYTDQSGSANTAVGENALYFNLNGGVNVAVGGHALYKNTASWNVAVGYEALYNNTSGQYNTANGYRALYSNDYGTENTAFGMNALGLNVSGSDNTAVGKESAYGNTSGEYNSSVGHQSLYYNATGGENTAIGHKALYNSIAGLYGVAIGAYAQEYANSQAGPWTNNNTAVGFRALRGSSNAAANTGNLNTAIGCDAVINNTSGNNNSALGYDALYTNTTGSDNVAAGYMALYYNTFGNNNVGIGNQTLLTNTTGSKNTAVGYYADVSSANLINATAIGYNAKVASSNSLVLGGTGADAVNVGIGTTTPGAKLDVFGNARIGTSSALIGTHPTYGSTYAALWKEGNDYALLTDGSNTLLNAPSATGSISLRTANTTRLIVTGSNGYVGIGTNAPSYNFHVVDPVSYATAMFVENTFVGAIDGVGLKSKALNNPYYGYGLQAEGGYQGINAYGNGTNSDGTIYGVYGWANGTAAAGTRIGIFGGASGGEFNYGVYCSGSGVYTGTWTLLSDQKFKKDIAPVSGALALVEQLNPVSYQLKTDEYRMMNFPSSRQYGFVAQELEKVIPLLVENGSHPGEKKGDKDIELKSVNYIGLIPVLTKALQELNDSLKSENNKLKTVNESQQIEIDDLRTRLAKVENMIENGELKK